MYARHNIRNLFHFENIPMIDGDFDRFELNHDLEMQLRESETANFYHDALNEEE
ncbi:MAG: hypothetical protein ABL867_10010 [Rickettsiales bacterium]